MPESTVLLQVLQDAVLVLLDGVQERQDGVRVLWREVRELLSGWPVPVLVSDFCCHWRWPD
jgi:hypothetical protein